MLDAIPIILHVFAIGCGGAVDLLEIIGAEVLVCWVPMDTFDAARSKFLAWIKILAISLTRAY